MNIAVHHALSFACDAHCKMQQTRKYTGEPYIVHPIEVMMLVREHGGSVDQQCAALLHDVVEDTNVTLNQIYDEFGKPVANLVYELTEPDHQGNRAERKTLECQRLAGISKDAMMIKLADLISNSRTIVTRDPNFAKTYLREKVQILNAFDASGRTHRALQSMAWDIVPLEYRP